MAGQTGYYDFVRASLSAAVAASHTAGSVKRRLTSRHLAEHVLNKIRRSDPDRPSWQPPLWRARHKLTGRMRIVVPRFDPQGIGGLVDAEERLILAHSDGDRVRLRATLDFVNSRVESGLSPCCFGGRPDAARRGTDRRAALHRFRMLVRDRGLRWVAKLDIRNFFDAIPHGPLLNNARERLRDEGCVREIAGYLAWYWRQRWPGWESPPDEPFGVPQGSPVSGVLANIYLTAFDRALEAAGVEFLRYLDDVTLVAASPEDLATALELAMRQMESLGMQLRPEKTRAAWLGVGVCPREDIDVPRRNRSVPVERTFDILGIEFLGCDQFAVRKTTINRLLRRVRATIRADRGRQHELRRFFQASRRVNHLLGYEVAKRRPGTRGEPHGGSPLRATSLGLGHVSCDPQPMFVVHIRGRRRNRCWIARSRYVQPRQHAVLGHSDLILEQLRKVDRTIRRWINREFGNVLARRRVNRKRGGRQRPGLGAWRVRSAARMYEMAVVEA